MLRQLDGVCQDIVADFQWYVEHGNKCGYDSVKDFGKATFAQIRGAVKLAEITCGVSAKETHKIANFYLDQILEITKKSVDKQ